MPEEFNGVTPLTDPVVEDISKQSPSMPDTPDPTIPPSDLKPPVPASAKSLSKPSKNLLSIPLIVITLISVIATSIFYFQNQQLKTQVQDLTNTLEAQETNIAPQPQITPEIILEPTVIPDPEATPTPTPTTIQTETETQQALNLAQTKYKDAQLILITSNNPHIQDETLTKYWFRQSTNSKTYLYISFLNGESSLVDQQVYVSPDNNIPSLNQRLAKKELGVTQNQALSHTNSLCQEPEKCQQAYNVKTQFLDTGTRLLWQVVYQIQDPSQSIVFQIDSLTKEVIYQSQK
jgi:hypothetical protein